MVPVILGIGGIYFLVFIVSIIAVCVWFYRANQNLHRSGLDNIKHTNGWSVGWFFVPFANLVKPAQVLGEIEKGSNNISGEFATSSWQSQKTDNAVTLWWVCYIGSGVLSNISGKMFDEFNLGANNYSLISGLEFASVALLAVSALMLIKVTTKVTKTQESTRIEEII